MRTEYLKIAFHGPAKDSITIPLKIGSQVLNGGGACYVCRANVAAPLRAITALPNVTVEKVALTDTEFQELSQQSYAVGILCTTPTKKRTIFVNGESYVFNFGVPRFDLPEDVQEALLKKAGFRTVTKENSSA